MAIILAVMEMVAVAVAVVLFVIGNEELGQRYLMWAILLAVCLQGCATRNEKEAP